MPFPLIVSGIVALTNAGIPAPGLGPFLSSNGDTYFFARSTTATTLAAYKGTSYPFNSFTNVANKTGFTTEILQLGGIQVSDVIHIMVQDGTAGTSQNLKYETFDMSTDAFVLDETVTTAMSTGSSQFLSCDCAVRSGGEVVAFYQGPTGSGTKPQLYYSRRTGVNTWTAGTLVSANNGTDQFCRGACILGASDRVHFFFQIFNSDSHYRSLSSTNVLDTQSTEASFVDSHYSIQSYDRSGTQKIAGGSDEAALFYFDSAANPTTHRGTARAIGTGPTRTYLDNNKNIWVMSPNNIQNGMFVCKSTDDGATFSIDSFKGLTVTTDTPIADDKLVIRGHSLRTFQRGADETVGFMVKTTTQYQYYEYNITEIPNFLITPRGAIKQTIVRSSFW